VKDLRKVSTVLLPQFVYRILIESGHLQWCFHHCLQAGVEVQVFDPREMRLEFPGSNPTPDALAMTKAVAESTGVIVATPEYHVGHSDLFFVTPLLPALSPLTSSRRVLSLRAQSS
jgi:hypothetical protein